MIALNDKCLYIFTSSQRLYSLLLLIILSLSKCQYNLHFNKKQRNSLFLEIYKKYKFILVTSLERKLFEENPAYREKNCYHLLIKTTTTTVAAVYQARYAFISRLAPFALLQRNAHRGAPTVQWPDFCVWSCMALEDRPDVARLTKRFGTTTKER